VAEDIRWVESMATGPSLSPPMGIEIEIGRGHAVGKGRPAGWLARLAAKHRWLGMVGEVSGGGATRLTPQIPIRGGRGWAAGSL